MPQLSASRLSSDITLTLLARVLPGLLSLVAVPVYLRLLGARSYAIIGLFLTLQSIIGLLDFGMSATVTREAAWELGRGASRARLAVILRTFRLPFLWIGGAVVLIGLAAGRVLLLHVFGDRISETGFGNQEALLLVTAIGLRFPMSVYTGFLSGVGRINASSAIVMVGDTARVACTLLAMWLWSRSLTVFFAVHCVASIAMLGAAAALSRRELGRPALAVARVDWTILRESSSLIVGSGALSLLFVCANGIDKLVLPRFATPEDFGAYVALGQLAVVPFLIVHAVWTASHPRLLSAMARADDDIAAGIFRLCAGSMTALACAIIVFAFASAHWLAARWLGVDVRLADAPFILCCLSLGYVAAALSHLAISVQQARRQMTAGALRLVVCLLVMAAIATVRPSILTPVGCAALWCGLYCAYLLSGLWTFGEVTGGLLRIWVRDVLLPLLVSAIAATACYQTVRTLSPAFQLLAGVLTAALAVGAVVAANGALRSATAASMRRLLFRKTAAART